MLPDPAVKNAKTSADRLFGGPNPRITSALAWGIAVAGLSGLSWSWCPSSPVSGAPAVLQQLHSCSLAALLCPHTQCRNQRAAPNLESESWISALLP